MAKDSVWTTHEALWYIEWKTFVPLFSKKDNIATYIVALKKRFEGMYISSTTPYITINLVSAGFMLTSGVLVAFAQPNYKGGLSLAINLIATMAYVAMANARRHERAPLGIILWKRALVRSVDWLITFPLIQIELLFMFGHHPSDSEFPTLTFTVFFLGLFVILPDAVFRNAFQTLDKTSIYLWATLELVSASFLVALTVVYFRMDHTPSVTATQRAFNYIFVATWYAYPVVVLVSDARDYTLGKACRERASVWHLVEDVVVALLDLISKALLAVTVAFR